jgi:hypothetical protein
MVWTGRTLSFTFQYFYLAFVGLLARIEYAGSPAAGHLDTGVLRFLCLQRNPEMFPRFEVARAASLAPPAI